MIRSRSFVLVGLLAVLAPGAGAQILISEFLARNSTNLADEDGDFSDWIEVANAGATTVDLGGMYLTDDAATLDRWALPSVSLGGGEYLVIFASGKDRRDPAGELHTSFKLSGEGEYLALVDTDGASVLFEYAPEYLPQSDDVSFGLVDGDTMPPGYYFATPTPGAVNDQPFQIEPPEFSVPRGFHETSFSLELSSELGDEIYYTLDASRPNRSNGILYSGPIPIDTTTVVRAKVYATGAVASEAVTHSYFFLDHVIDSAVMSPAITDDPVYGPLMRSSLESHATVSVVTANDLNEHREIQASAELLVYAESEPGFQINCGAKYVGGHSLSYAKKSIRLYFRDNYGPTKLRYPLFPEHPYSIGAAESFDQLQLRSGGHDSVFYLGTGAQFGDAQYLRNRWASDVQMRLGHESLHGRFIHVYLNGVYWGHYQLMERPQESHIASYMGGEKDDFAFTNAGRNGDVDVWNTVLASASDWQLAQDWVDIPNLIDYMLVNYYGGNDWDWNTNQNWMAAGPRLPGQGGWKFFCWDSDIAFQQRSANVTNPSVPNRTGNYNNAPGGLFTDLRVHPDFRMQVADQIHQRYTSGGELTRKKVREAYDHRATELEVKLIAETARWTNGEWTRDAHWTPERERLNNHFFGGRTRVVLGQLRDEGLYPQIDPPIIELVDSDGSGAPGSGFEHVTLRNPNIGGDIFYTTDGSDPRAPGGGIAGDLYSGSIPRTRSMHVRTRVRELGEWSAIVERLLIAPQDRTGLTIAEIHYHPLGEGTPGFPNHVDGDEYEFIELLNRGATSIDLSGVELRQGIEYRFPLGTTLAPGVRLVLAGSAQRFAERYGRSPFDQYEGRLDNAGDRPVLVDTLGGVLDMVPYEDDHPWPPEADGGGYSLEVIDPTRDNHLPTNWRRSNQLHGSPGQ